MGTIRTPELNWTKSNSFKNETWNSLIHKSLQTRSNIHEKNYVCLKEYCIPMNDFPKNTITKNAIPEYIKNMLG